MIGNSRSDDMAAKPRVSVVIPAYNRVDMLRRAVISALGQTYRHLEVLVVDDGSDHDVGAILRSIDDLRLKVIRHDANRGASAARNTGIRHAAGEIIAFLDSDDEWEPTCVERRLDRFATASPDTVMVYSGVRVVPPSKPPRDQYLRGDLSQALVVRNVIGSTSCVMVRRCTLEAIGGFDESLPSCQDWDIYIRLAALGPIETVNELLVIYYMHSNSITSSGKASITGHRLLKKKHAAAIAALPPPLRAQHQMHLAELFMWKRAWRDAASCMLAAVNADPRVGLKALDRLVARKVMRLGRSLSGG